MVRHFPFFLPPDLSPSRVGTMPVGAREPTDSCWSPAVRLGRTSDHLLGASLIGERAMRNKMCPCGPARGGGSCCRMLPWYWARNRSAVVAVAVAVAVTVR